MAEVKMNVDNGASGTKQVSMNYPSNSHKGKKQVEKVIKGEVKQRKKTTGEKFSETFFGDSMDAVKHYIVHDVLIPAAKDAISDMVKGGIEMLLFGEKQGSRTSRDRGKSYVSYNSYSKGDRRERDRREPSRTSRARHNFDDIVLDSRGEAEEVLSHLVDLTIDYGEATVADLYDLVGVTGNFTDNKFGWKDLSSASVSRVRDGYALNLPKVRTLD